MNLLEQELKRAMTRRHFFSRASTGLGTLALASLLNENLFAAAVKKGAKSALPSHGALGSLHFAPKARRVIYLFMSGAPSHIDLFDPKPKLVELSGTELPKSVRGDQRITGMTSGQKQLLCVGSPFKFAKHGQCGLELSELLPHLSNVVDDLALIRGMHTEPINNSPGVADNRCWGATGSTVFCPAIIKACSSAARAIRYCSSPTRRASARGRAGSCSTASRTSTAFSSTR